MLGSNRGIFVAVAGLALLSAAQPPPKGAQSNKAAEKTPPAPPPVYSPYPDRQADSCYQAKDHDAADLCAQWRAAAAAAEEAAHEARRATNWGIIATILSAIGLGFLLWSLRQTEGALGEARRANLIAQRANARATRQAIASAAAARKANEISERVAQAELRPYLFVDKINLRNVLDFTTVTQEEGEDEVKTLGSLIADVEVHLRNVGKVPARNIVAYQKSYLARLDRGTFFNYRFIDTPMDFCAPGNERRVFNALYISAEDRQDFDWANLSFILRLRITFKDDAGQSYTERADYRFSGNDLETFYLLLKPLNIAERRKKWQEGQLDLQQHDEDEDDHDPPPK